MAQYQITVDSQVLHQLFMSKSKDSGVSALLESVLNQILQAEATEQLQAEPYERTDERQGYRNGTYSASAYDQSRHLDFKGAKAEGRQTLPFRLKPMS